MNTVKTHESIVAELDRTNKAPINYSDIPPHDGRRTENVAVVLQGFFGQIAPRYGKRTDTTPPFKNRSQRTAMCLT